MSTDIIAAIDGALEDWQTSGDAMRWRPPEQQHEPPEPPQVRYASGGHVNGPVEHYDCQVFVVPGQIRVIGNASRFDAALDAILRVAWRAQQAVMPLNEALIASVEAAEPVYRLARPDEWERDDDPLTWQSDMCAAWLHDSCRSATDCRCTCHGGHLR